MQVVAAAQPQDLGKRRRKKVSYNETNLARDRATHSTTDSDHEYKGSEEAGADDEDDDEDGSGTGTGTAGTEGEEGRKVGRPKST